MTKRPLVRSTLLSLIVVSLLAPGAVATAAAQDGPHGVWNGAVEVPGQSLEVVITLRQAAEGAWNGTIDIPAQGLADFPLSDIAIAAGAVSFAMAGIPGDPQFVGSWDAAAQTISGDFEQAGNAFPFSLNRTGDAAAAVDAAIDAETAAKITGSWLGTIATGGGELRMVFHLEYADGTLRGTMDSPDQGQSGLPISAVAFDGNTLRVDLDYAGAYFEGDLSADGASIAGAWNQGGGAAPLTMNKQ